MKHGLLWLVVWLTAMCGVCSAEEYELIGLGTRIEGMVDLTAQSKYIWRGFDWFRSRSAGQITAGAQLPEIARTAVREPRPRRLPAGRTRATHALPGQGDLPHRNVDGCDVRDVPIAGQSTGARIDPDPVRDRRIRGDLPDAGNEHRHRACPQSQLSPRSVRPARIRSRCQQRSSRSVVNATRTRPSTVN